jgi:DNA-directed RNA polymerase subunit K/omega
MNFEDFDEFDDEEEIDVQLPDLDQPEFEEVFQSDINQLIPDRERVGSDRISKPTLGKLAKARLIAARAGQLELGASPQIPFNRLRSNEPQKIAQQELQEKVIPLKIVRKFPDGTFEVWTIKDFKYIVRD